MTPQQLRTQLAHRGYGFSVHGLLDGHPVGRGPHDDLRGLVGGHAVHGLRRGAEVGRQPAVLPPPARGGLVQGGRDKMLAGDCGEGEHLAIVGLEAVLEAAGADVHEGDVAGAVAHCQHLPAPAHRQTPHQPRRPVGHPQVRPAALAPGVQQPDGALASSGRQEGRGRGQCSHAAEGGAPAGLVFRHGAAHEGVPQLELAVAARHQPPGLQVVHREDSLPVAGVAGLGGQAGLALALVPDGPQPHRAVPAARQEAVLVVQHRQRLDAARVAGEGEQLDLLEVEGGVPGVAPHLVLPVGEPRAPQLPAAVHNRPAEQLLVPGRRPSLLLLLAHHDHVAAARADRGARRHVRVLEAEIGPVELHAGHGPVDRPGQAVLVAAAQPLDQLDVGHLLLQEGAAQQVVQRHVGRVGQGGGQHLGKLHHRGVRLRSAGGHLDLVEGREEARDEGGEMGPGQLLADPEAHEVHHVQQLVEQDESGGSAAREDGPAGGGHLQQGQEEVGQQVGQLVHEDGVGE